MGLLEGLKLVKDKGARECIIKGDSSMVISWGKGPNCVSWRLKHYLSKIKALIKELDAELLHVLRTHWWVVETNVIRRFMTILFRLVKRS